MQKKGEEDTPLASWQVEQREDGALNPGPRSPAGDVESEDASSDINAGADRSTIYCPPGASPARSDT